jgi:protein O-mannosyl-transferase
VIQAKPGFLPGPSHRSRMAVLAILVLTTGCFLPVLSAAFLNLDDPAYVTRNPNVLGGMTLQGLHWAFTSFDSANWHPLTWLSHMADVSLFGLRAGAHHGTSLALHALAAAFLLLALERMTGALWPGFVAAALFAVHPLRVESVAWVSERKDVLSGLFGMLALLLYLRYASRPRPGRYLAVFAVFALGLMAKPMLVTLPFVLLLLDWWPLGRFRGPSSGAVSRVTARQRLLVEKVPLMVLSAASCAVTYLAQRRGGAMVSAEVFPFVARVGNALASYVGYLAKMLWPHRLVPFYPHLGPVLSPGEFALCLALLGVVTAVAVVHRGRRPWLLVGWLWYLGTLVPVIGLVQVGLQGMADRYTYLPGIGPVLALVWEARSRALPRVRGRAAFGGGAAAVLAILALFTWRQASWWKDTATLFNRVITVDPRNYFAFNMLGADSYVRGDSARAEALFARALALRPEYYVARYNYALALAANGRSYEALAQFTAVIRFNPRDAESHFNRGRLLLDAGNAEAALRDFEAALAVQPEERQFRIARDRALALLGRAR